MGLKPGGAGVVDYREATVARNERFLRQACQRAQSVRGWRSIIAILDRKFTFPLRTACQLLPLLLLRLMFPLHENLGATQPTGASFVSFVLEAILTAMLMFVILAVSSGAKEKGLMAGIAVGGVVAFEALFVGPICDASMNPTRSPAPAVVSGSLGHLWIYLVAPLIGSDLGVFSCRLVHPPGCCQRSSEPQD